MPKKKEQTKNQIEKKHEVEVLPSDPFVEISSKVNELTEKDSLTEAKHLTEDIECNYFKLGGVLAKINDEGWWASEGFVSFKIFVEAELGMKYRKAMYLVSIYTHLVEAGIPYEKVKKIGWTKLSLLAPVLTEENADEWVETAESMNTLQLAEEIKVAGKQDNDEEDDQKPNDIKSKVFKLHDDQREVIEEAIEVAKSKANTEYDAVALEAICLEYLGKPTATKESKSKKKKIEEKAAEPIVEEIKEEELDEVIDAYEEVSEDLDFDEVEDDDDIEF